MKRQILFIMESDPATSGRVGEAIRIAAGIQAWDKVEVRVYLHHPAMRALGRDADFSPDADSFHQGLKLLDETAPPVLVPVNSIQEVDRETGPVRFQEMTEDQLAKLAAQSHAVMRF